MSDDLYAIYYELSGSGGSVIRGPKDTCLNEAGLIAENYCDVYIEVFRVKDHKKVFIHEGGNYRTIPDA